MGRKNQCGSTSPGTTMVVIAVLVVVIALDVCRQRLGFGISWSTSLLVAVILTGLYWLVRVAIDWLFGRYNRHLARKFGIGFAETAPPHFKGRLDGFGFLSGPGVGVQVHFYLKDEGSLRMAVFYHCWSTGFGDGRREHSGRGFVADLSGVPEITSAEVLALFEPAAGLESATHGSLLVVLTRNAGNPAFVPERILVKVAELYRQRAASNGGHSASDAGEDEKVEQGRGESYG